VGAAQAALLLGRSLLSQARFSDAIDVAAALARDGGSAGARAEVLWGTVLSLEGADLEGAAAHFRSAEASGMLEGDPEVLAQIRFELGSVRAQQGQLEQAIAHYREALALAERDGSEQTLAWQILAHNNLGYHLFLLGDAGARAHAEAGLRIARERGVIGLETYLLSTLGEIALGEVDLDTAERWFQQGLDLAEQLATPERIAGLSANLGRVAAAREQQALAIHRFSLALAQADAIGTRHLAAQIRIWLAPLLPPTEARRTIAEARAIAVASGRRRLLDELARVEQALAVAK
jgi:tetratricopeptide (TPR) repeat protein